MQPEQIMQKAIIKDKQKLFSKLFISPSYQPFESINFQSLQQMKMAPLLVSPDFINLLLEQSSKSTRQYQLCLIDEILQIFSKRQINSLLLYRVDRQSKQFEKSILDSIVLKILKLAQTEIQVDIYIGKIKKLLRFYKISLKNISKLTKYLSKSTYLQKFEPIKLKFIIKILKLYYSEKSGFKQSPQNYFLCLGSQNSCIQPSRYSADDLFFKNQLTITVVFKPESYIESDPDLNNLVSITTQKNGELGIQLTNNKLYLRYSNSLGELKRSIQVCDNIQFKWYRFVLILNEHATISYLNDNQQKKFESILNFLSTDGQNQNPSQQSGSPKNFLGLLLGKKKSDYSAAASIKFIKECLIGHEYLGLLGSVIIANRCWDISNKFSFDSYRYGFQNWDSLILLNKTQLHQTIIYCCLPFTCFSSREYLISFDVFKKNHSFVGENISNFEQMKKQEDVMNLGGFKIILPLFYLARFYSPEKYPNLLVDLLDLLLTVFKTYQSKYFQEELQSKSIFEIFGEHLQELENFHNLKTIQQIYQLYGKLYREVIKKKFISAVIWKISTSHILHVKKQHKKSVFDVKKQMEESSQHRKQTSEIIKAYYGLIIKLYEDERKLCLDAFTFEEIVYWTVQNLQSSMHDHHTFSCCLEHYLSELSLSQKIPEKEISQKVHENLVRVSSSMKREHYKYIEVILTNILEYEISKTLKTIPNTKTPPSQQQKQKILENFKLLLRLFLRKYSTCLYKMVLSIIKRIIRRFRDDKKIIYILQDDSIKLIDFFALLADRTLHPTIISDILYIVGYLKIYGLKARKNKLYQQFMIYLLERYGIFANKSSKQISVAKIIQMKRKKSNDFCSLPLENEVTNSRSQKRQRKCSAPSICKRSKNELLREKGQKKESQEPELDMHRWQSIKSVELSNYTPLFNIIFNLVLNVSSQQEQDMSKFVLANKQSISILARYYNLLACELFQENILTNILSCVQNSPHSIISVKQLHIFLLQCVHEIIINSQSKPHQQAFLKHLITIYTAIFSHLMNTQKSHQLVLDAEEESILSCYCLIKSINPVAVTFLMSQILPNMIGAMQVHQLVEILLILNMEKIFMGKIELASLQLEKGCGIKWLPQSIDKFKRARINAIFELFDQLQTSIGTSQLLSEIIKLNNQDKTSKIQKILSHQIFQQKIKLEDDSTSVFSIDVILSKLITNDISKKLDLASSQNKKQEEEYIINKSEENSPNKVTPIEKKEDFKMILQQLEAVYEPGRAEIQRIENQLCERDQKQYEEIYCQQIDESTSKEQEFSVEAYHTKQFTLLQFILDYAFDVLQDYAKIQTSPLFPKNQKKQSLQSLYTSILNFVQIYITASVFNSINPPNKLTIRLICYYFVYRSLRLKKKHEFTFIKSGIQLWAYILHTIIFPNFVGSSQNEATEYPQIVANLHEKNICSVFLEDLQLYFNYGNLSELAHLYKEWTSLDQFSFNSIEAVIKLLSKSDFINRCTFDNNLLSPFSSIQKINSIIIRQILLKQIIFNQEHFYKISSKSERKKISRKLASYWDETNFNLKEFERSLKMYINLHLAGIFRIKNIKEFKGKAKIIFQQIRGLKRVASALNSEIMEQNDGEELEENLDEDLLKKYLEKTEKLFQVESAIEEKKRIRYLYQTECHFRKMQSQWNRIWDDLRIYHHPYGLWMAQKNISEIFTYSQEQNRKFKNFKFYMSQVPTNSGIYPILQAKMIEPWHIIKDQRRQSSKYYHSFSEMIDSHRFQDKYRKENEKSKNNFFTDIWENVWGVPKRNKVTQKQYEVLWISRSEKALGKLYIQNKQYLIFDYQSTRQDDSHLAFQKFVLDFNKETFKRWEIHKIQKIRYHRYLLKYTALSFSFLKTNNDPCELIFNFIHDDKKQFLRELQKIYKEKAQNAQQLKLYRINRIPFFMDHVFDYQNNQEVKEACEKWRKRQISNFQYLIKVNKLAFRGIYDLSQYPVVPWITQMKATQKQPVSRDLSKTMGALGNEQRKKILLEKFYSHDPFNPHPAFFFGTHYSSPGVIFNYLIRLSPFTQYCKQLQGGKFDIPDRLFSSLMGSWKSATEEVSDVRQLIPQFYYLPEVLLNIDENYFGLTQLKQTVNHVDIPAWGASNAYYFVMQLKIMMESQWTSSRINEWIDLIFGYKQKGKEAEQALNIYYYLTYQQSMEADQEQDEVYQKSKQAQIMHFGQIPPLLFEKPHPVKTQLKSTQKFELYFSKKYLIPNMKEKPLAILITQSTYQETVILKRNQLQVVSLQTNPCQLLKVKKINIQKSCKQQYYLIKKQKLKTVFFSKSGTSKISTSANNLNDLFFILIYGYLDNQFRIYNPINGQVVDSDQVDFQVLTCYVNQADQLIILGLKNGLLLVYQIEYGTSDLIIKKIATEVFPSAISHISFCEGFYSIAFGNYCAIYKIYRTLHYYPISNSGNDYPLKFFRSFQNPLPINNSFITMSPLPCIVLTDNAHIKVFSINGQLLKTKSVSTKISSIEKYRDLEFNDLICILEDEKYCCLTIPDLRTVSVLDIYNENEFSNCFLNNTIDEEKVAPSKYKNEKQERQIEWILENGIVGGQGWMSYLKWGQNH